VDNPLVQVDPGLYIWTIITFIVLLVLLRKFAWQPLLKALDDRQKTIARAVDDARQAREQLERAQQDSNKVLAQARVEAEELLNRARVDAEQFRQELKTKAAAEAANIGKEAERTIQREAAKAIDQIRREAVDLSVAIASKLIRREIKASDQDVLLSETVKEIERKPGN
jgi:F-type H+-transporting ATPase subunit b